MKTLESCTDPGCWVGLQVARYYLELARLGLPKPEPLNLQTICPHRFLCGRCEIVFVTKRVDPACVQCQIPVPPGFPTEVVG